MIDPVALDRLVHAVSTGTRAHFDAPLPDKTQELYYRELAWMGFTVRQIEKATGWNGSRIQRRLQEHTRLRNPLEQPELLWADAPDTTISARPGALLLNVQGTTVVIEGNDEQLLHLARLIYSAATNHEETHA